MTDSRHTDAATPPTPLAPNLIAAEVDGGRIAENIMQFGQVSRSAGLSGGPDPSIPPSERPPPHTSRLDDRELTGPNHIVAGEACRNAFDLRRQGKPLRLK